MEHIQIRRASPADVDLLQSLGRQTFTEAFAANNTAENLASYLEEGFSAEKLTAELQNPDSEFYFAVLEARAIGYLKLNSGRAQTELQQEKALEIERIYVLQEFHGKKVGQLLYEKALQVAQQKNAHYVWLGVWEENHRAIRFYQKNGFVAFGKHLFRLGNEEQTDILMKRQLR